MKVSVYDTYVKKKDGHIMHFDILVPSAMADMESICAYGREFINTKGQTGQPLTSRECRLCHEEEATSEIKKGIAGKGYFIIEMEGC
jgi:hypothetical protein